VHAKRLIVQLYFRARPPAKQKLIMALGGSFSLPFVSHALYALRKPLRRLHKDIYACSLRRAGWIVISIVGVYQ